MLLAVTSFSSCEEDLMDFEGEESLYFDARWYSSNVRDHSMWPHRRLRIRFQKSSVATIS